MFTQPELDDIDRRLREGQTLENIAANSGKTLQAMRYALAMSGKKLAVSRRLVDCAPAPISDDSAREMAAA